MSVREVSEIFWKGTWTDEHNHPVSVVMNTLPVESFQEGLGFMYTFANVSVINTDVGLVLIDCGALDYAIAIQNELDEWSGGKPIHTCIYTHGHIDHCMGIIELEPMQKEKTNKGIRVVAHKNVVPRFERYKKTANYNALINSRQFQEKAEWPTHYRYPDITYRDSMVLEIGEKKKEKLILYHDKGETDDSTWVWMPERKVIMAGDLFIYCTPNCGNPQKAQRFPVEWAIALRKMLALNAELLFPGHGPPIIGKDRVKQALTDTAVFLESICNQTLAGINSGKSLNEILHSVKIDPKLLEKPYLRPIYDDPYFIVHNLWRLYCGWWDFNPANLRPVENSVLGKEIIQLSGGADRLIARALKMSENPHDLNLAVQLIEYVLKAQPNSHDLNFATAHQAAIKIYMAKVEQEPSTMAKGIYGAACRESEMALARIKSNL